MSKDDDWYRSGNWAASDQALFAEKIGRARSNFHRQQYARIKAISLLNTGDLDKAQAAISMLQRSLVEWESEYTTEAEKTYVVLGDAYRALGDYVAASKAYRTSLTWDESDMHLGYWHYPEMIISESLVEQYPEALDIVTTYATKHDLVFAAQKFVYHAVRAVVWSSSAKTKEAKVETAEALEQATRTDSGFSRHAAVGLVNEASRKSLLQRLQQL